METVLVTGASGALGSAAVRLLLTQGYKVRAMSRSSKKRSALSALGAQAVAGDLCNAESLLEACRGVNKVISAAHSFLGRGRNGPEWVDGRGNCNLIEAARRSGVDHFIFASIQGVDPDHAIDFFRVKYGVEAYLKASGLPYTILRPGPFMNTWAEVIGRPILKYGMTVIIGKGETPLNFVAAEDVSRVAAWALQDDRAVGRTFDVCGPQVLTMKQVAMIFEMLAGRPATRIHIPLGLMQAVFAMMRPLAPALSRRLGTCFLEMSNPSDPINMTALLKLFSFKPLSMDEYVRIRFLGASRVRAGIQAYEENGKSVMRPELTESRSALATTPPSRLEIQQARK